MVRRRYLAFLCAVVAALGSMIGCGGSGGGSGATISGAITADTFTVAAGSAREVVADTTIVATTAVDIEGTLNVDPGVNLLIEAPTVTINGKIQTTGALSAVRAKSLARAGCRTSGLTLVTDKLVGGSLQSTGSISVAPQSSRNLLVKSISLTTESSGDGCDGPNIEIGTAKAVSNAQQGYPKTSATSAQGLVLTAAQFNAGAGGRGVEPIESIDGSGALNFEGGKGGNGGSVNIAASGQVLADALTAIYAGAGGPGGSAVSLTGKPGSAGSKGQSVVAQTGDGGDGGSFFYSSGAGSTALTAKGGDAGAPGSVLQCAPGNGGANPSGAPGAGGDLTIRMGLPGKTGQNTTPIVVPPAASQISCTGGNGASASVPGTSGANGGTLKIANRDGTAYAGPVTVAKGFSGGDGLGACAPTVTAVGGSGGNGGVLLRYGATNYLISGFNGGKGGDGAAAGSGGLSGRDDANVKLGNDGTPGKVCGQVLFDESIYYPTPAGRTWNYHYAYGFGGSLDFSTVVSALDKDPVSGAPALPFNNYVSGAVVSTNYTNVSVAGGVQNYTTIYIMQSGNQTVSLSPPETIPHNLATSAPNVQSIQRTVKTSAQTTTTTYSVTVTFVGLEDVSVPAGTFLSCAKVTFVYGSGASADTVTRWFAPGVGLVKYTDSASGDLQTLTSYH